MDLDTTIGGNASNSMVTVDGANVYIADSPYPTTAWDDLDDDAKGLRLALAAKFMVSRFTWIGVQLHINQAMPFPRYLPPRRFTKGAWPLGTLYPIDWNDLLLYSQLSQEQIDALDVIPDDIKRAQSYIAYGVIHRGMVSVTDPATGPKTKPQIKSLSLFDSLSVTVASQTVQMAGATMFDLATQSEHFIITSLLENWISQISWGYGTQTRPPLPEVESTGTLPSL